MATNTEWPKDAAERLRRLPDESEIDDLRTTTRIPLRTRSSSLEGRERPGPVSFPPRPRRTVSPASSAPRPTVPAPSAEREAPRRRRAEVRRPVHIEFELLRRNEREAEFAIGADLTATGALLLTDSRLDIGELVHVRFRIPWSSARYSFVARVVRAQVPRPDEIGALFGFGLEFQFVSEAARAALRESLRGIPPALPPALPVVSKAS